MDNTQTNIYHIGVDIPDTLGDKGIIFQNAIQFAAFEQIVKEQGYELPLNTHMPDAIFPLLVRWIDGKLAYSKMHNYQFRGLEFYMDTRTSVPPLMDFTFSDEVGEVILEQFYITLNLSSFGTSYNSILFIPEAIPQLYVMLRRAIDTFGTAILYSYEQLKENIKDKENPVLHIFRAEHNMYTWEIVENNKGMFMSDTIYIEMDFHTLPYSKGGKQNAETNLRRTYPRPQR